MKINNLIKSLQMLVVCAPMIMVHRGAFAEMADRSPNSETTGIVKYEDDVSLAFIQKYYEIGGCETAGTLEEQTSALIECGAKGYLMIRLPICFSDDLKYLEAYYTCLQKWTKDSYERLSSEKYKVPCKSDGLEEKNGKYYYSYNKAIENTNTLIDNIQKASTAYDFRFVDQIDNPEFEEAYKFVKNKGTDLFDANCALIKKHFELLERDNKYKQLLSQHTMKHCDVQLEKIKKYLADNGGNAVQTTTVVDDPVTELPHPTNDKIYIRPAILADMLESGMYVDNPNLFVMHIRALSPDDFNKKQVITMKTLGQACLNYGMSKADCEKFIRDYIAEFNKGKK